MSLNNTKGGDSFVGEGGSKFLRVGLPLLLRSPKSAPAYRYITDQKLRIVFSAICCQYSFISSFLLFYSSQVKDALQAYCFHLTKTNGMFL